MSAQRVTLALLTGMFVSQAFADDWGFSFRYGRSRCDDVVYYPRYRDYDRVVYSDCAPRYYDTVVYRDYAPRVYYRERAPVVVRDCSPRVTYRSRSYYRSTPNYGARHSYSRHRSSRFRCDD